MCYDIQALGYEFDNDEFHQYVHGSLPYEKLKPDPVLRNLLLSTPQRKIVRITLNPKSLISCRLICYTFYHAHSPESSIHLSWIYVILQVFTNSDKAHAARALRKLGLEDCFEGIICFETLNQPDNPSSKSRILCKPSVESIEAAISIANLDPKRTVSIRWTNLVRSFTQKKTPKFS